MNEAATAQPIRLATTEDKFDEASHQRRRAEKNYAMVVEYSGRLASYDAKFAKLRAFVTETVGTEVVYGEAKADDHQMITLRNTVRLMKGKKPLKAHY